VAQWTDEQLLASYLSGDEAAFGVLVRRYQRSLHQFLFRFLGDATLAEDVFQETFVQVASSARQFNPTRALRPWLFTIAANKARDALRSRARQKTVDLDAAVDRADADGAQFLDFLASDEPPPLERLETLDAAHLTRQIVAAMPERLRLVLVLAYFQGLAYQEIAEILAVPLGTVKSRLHAAVASFAEAWRQRGGEADAPEGPARAMPATQGIPPGHQGTPKTPGKPFLV
jgi:RNA polymerase sigma-70 factor (ECF subfamily)